MQNLLIKEQIVKTVVKSGNGGAVWVPKKWLGQEVIVMLPKSAKEKILHLLEPYLADIMAVFIYGSYARKEQTEESDIDVLVITKDKDIKIKTSEKNLDISVFQLKNFKKAIQKHPVMYYQIIQEAQPLINSYLLDELRKIKIDKKAFRKYIKETKEHTKSNKELIELDKLEGKYVVSYSTLYSIILRLRGICIMKCLIKKGKFSNKIFKEWILSKGMTNIEYEQAYSAYRSIRDNKNNKTKVRISVAEKLLSMLSKETELIGADYGK